MQVTAKVNGVTVFGQDENAVINQLSRSFKDSVSGLVSCLREIDDDQTEINEYVANGSYVREMLIPKGTCVVGRVHKYECVNILLSGKIAIVSNDGQKQIMEAPAIFVSQPGHQKIGYAIEDTRWLNTFACDKKDVPNACELFTCESEEEYRLLIEEKL